jgi:hypothetical protein
MARARNEALREAAADGARMREEIAQMAARANALQAERDEALREAAAAMARPPEGEPDPLPRVAAKVKGTVATKATLQAMGEDSSALDAEIVELQEWLRWRASKLCSWLCGSTQRASKIRPSVAST